MSQNGQNEGQKVTHQDRLKTTQGAGTQRAHTRGLLTIQERPECDGDKRVDEPNALRRHTGPGGQMGDENELEQVEPDRTRKSDGAESHSTQGPPRDDEDERDIETNAPGRDPGGGGRVQVQDRSGDVEGDWDCQSDGDGIVFDWIRDQMDGAASDVRNGSKRADTKSLAMERRGQHGRRNRGTANAPRPPIPSNNHRRLESHPNPPRRRGRLKSRPTSIS